ncbi:putative LRR receptor-like serine/threonine-protein kinase [Vitis vinifera]|uniref:non-specific serine/threonine protein kinase n=1 Tax=Vitis vinifera TaxID=29760 RepID=A0A438D4M2_VITVI|nr:putative LRR receptor-like serine/threonine-protein kinase [Vitis vinifera]
MAWTRVFLLGAVLALSSFCLAAGQITHPSEVTALRAIRRKLSDPKKRLNNWKSKDPCASNWTGVICSMNPDDGYLHVQELRLLNFSLNGKLAPELGLLSYMTILDFMWNNISGSIPREIGDITSLKLLLLNGNQISGSLPEELGNLTNLNRFQVDLNNISGPLPKSFRNLTSCLHFHMNNNSISGQIPAELSSLPQLIHFLLDNNNLSGYLPPELSQMPKLKILQLDNNNFGGTEIPESYGNMSKLLKLSLRNCNLQGSIPNLSRIPNLHYLDLSHNQLTGSIPSNRLSNNITTIDLSSNMLSGSIPSSFSGLPHLERLSLENNLLNGSISSAIWENVTFAANATLTLDFQNNSFSNISGSFVPPSNVTIKLNGNPLCTNANALNIVQFCGTANGEDEAPGSPDNSNITCPSQSCPLNDHFEYVPGSPVSCYCAAPLGVGFRLRSPSISDFPPYTDQFKAYITSNLGLVPYQLHIDSFIWQKGPRLRMYLKFFPQYNNQSNTFNTSEIQRIRDLITTFTIPGDDIFGPYDLLNFTLVGPYSDVDLESKKSGISKGVIVGIVLGGLSFATAIVLVIAVVFWKKQTRHGHKDSKQQPFSKTAVIIEGVKGFSFGEMEIATENFSEATQIGQGGYGKVYKGILADGTVVAIKRAQQGSLQGEKEFFTEIGLLSRLHHRNLVSLIGYCDEEQEQMLVYEFMPHGSLHSLLSARSRGTLTFVTRLHIALCSAKGVLYLHTEAYPPIIHRDIKANNILLDSKFNAKVSDFGISCLVPVSDGEEGATAHVSTVVKGTPGYLDPEYFFTHKLTEKSDVYSLGIVFLELLTGMQPISQGRNIVREPLQILNNYSVDDNEDRWEIPFIESGGGLLSNLDTDLNFMIHGLLKVYEIERDQRVCTRIKTPMPVTAACQSGAMFSIIDQNMGPFPSDCVKEFMTLALRCSQDLTKDRPSMLEVVRELENISSMLPQAGHGRSKSDTSASGISVMGTTAVYPGRNSYVSGFPGSDLVSGVIPTIRPR